MDQFEIIHESVCVSGSDSATEEPTSCGCKLQNGETKTCCDHRCINFATQNECVDCSSNCSNRRLQNRAFKKLEAREVYPKGHGLFTLEDIQPGDLVTEYLGDIVSQVDLEKRFALMADRKEHHMYVMQLKPKVFVDSRYRGSIARFYNHSCNPNCKLEVWSVNGRLRLGIFATQSVSKNEELTIDYSWKLSGRPPTRCYCKSHNCRGFLEIFNQDDIDEVLSRKGTWISCREREVLSSNHFTTTTSTSIFDQNHRVIPDKILHKYVKMWYEDTQSFVETRVEESCGHGRYLLLDIFRKDTFEEDLDAHDANWLWLDESQPGTIRKRLETAENDEDDYEEVKSRLLTTSSSRMSNNNDDTSSSHTHTHIYANMKQQTFATTTTTTRCLKIKFKIAFYLIYHRVLNHDENNDVSLKRKIIDDFAYFLINTFPTVRTKFVDANSNGQSRETMRNSFDLDITGDTVMLKNINDMLINTLDEVIVKEQVMLMVEKECLFKTQGDTIHIDWRVLPVLSPQQTSSKIPGYNTDLLSLSHAIAKSSSFTTQPKTRLSQLLLPVELLPVIFYSPSSSKVENSGVDELSAVVGYKQYSLTRSMEVTLKLQLEASIIKAKLPEMITFPSLVILTRYLLFIDETNVIRDTVTILSAVIMLTLKSRHIFRLRYLKKIIKSVYMIVFNRSENEVLNNSTDSYILRVVEKEANIVSKLQHDLYVPNIFTSSIIAKAIEEIRDVWNAKALKALSLLVIHASIYLLSFQLEHIQLTVFLLTLLASRVLTVEEMQVMIQAYCEEHDLNKQNLAMIAVLLMEVISSHEEMFKDHVSWLNDREVEVEEEEEEEEDDSYKMDVDGENDEASLKSVKMSKAELITSLTTVFGVQSLPSISSLLAPKPDHHQSKASSLSSSSRISYWLQPQHSSYNYDKKNEEKKRKYRLHPITSAFIQPTTDNNNSISSDHCTSLGKDMCLVEDAGSCVFVRALPLTRTAKR